MSMINFTQDAQLARSVLRGIFLVYKPPGIIFQKIRTTILANLCRDLNDMETRPANTYVSIEGATNSPMEVVVRPSFADHPLVAGPRYIEEEFHLSAANQACPEASGLLVCGISGHGRDLAYKLRKASLTRFYKLKGVMGQARHNNYADGRIVEKSTWKHIKRHQVDRICASLQASHQKKMFELCGFNIQTQAAYELAVKGPIRSAIEKIPMIYTIKCVDFKPPEFTLEIVCMNEDHDYLKDLIAEVGYKLKSTAHCSAIQCSQYGLFNVRDALLSKHWHLENILASIGSCNRILKEHPYMLKHEEPNLVEQTQRAEIERERNKG